MPIRLWICIFISLRSGSQRCRKKIRRAKRVGVHGGQTSEHAREIACVIYLVFFTSFSDVTFFCFLRVNMGWDANSLSARILHLLHQFVPDLYSVTLFLPTSSNTAYSLSGIGRFDKISPCPHEDHSAGTAFVLGKYQICVADTNPRSLRYISSSRQRFIDHPELLFTTLFSCPRSRFLYSGGHAQWQRQ